MSSVIKNPIILNSANYIYNWFLSINHKNDDLIKNANYLEAVESDEVILSNLNRNLKNEENYNNFDDRLKRIKEKMNE